MSEETDELEQIPSKTLEDGTVVYQCPNCGDWVEYFEWFGDIKSPMCPSCKKLVKRDLIPPEAIVWKPAGSGSTRSKKSRKRGKSSKTESLLRAEEIRKIAEEVSELPDEESFPRKIEREASIEMEESMRDEGLFEAPKTPEKIVFEILSQYKHIKTEFIRAMVRRSKLKGGLTPDELKYFMLSMKSGVKSEAEAQFIAEEYKFALEREAKKAQKMGYPISYPIGITGSRTSPPIGYGSYPSATARTYGGYPTTSTFTPASTYSPSTQAQSQNIEAMINQLRQEFQMQIRQILEEKERRKIEDKLHELEKEQERRITDILNMIKEMNVQWQQQMQQMVQAFQEQLQQVVQIAKTPPENVVTRDDFEKFMLEQQRMMLEKQLELLMERDKEKSKQIEELLKEIKNWRDKSEKEKLELLKKIEELSRREPYKPEGYKSDEMRLIAEGLHTLANVVQDRKPVEVVVKAVPKLLGQPQTVPHYTEVPSESKSTVTDLLKGTEYVAEE